MNWSKPSDCEMETAPKMEAAPKREAPKVAKKVDNHDPHEFATILLRALMSQQGRDLMQCNRVKVIDRMTCAIKCGRQIPNAVIMEPFFDVVVHENQEGTTLYRCFANYAATSLARKSHGCRSLELYSKKTAEFPNSFIIAIHRPARGELKSLTECQVPEWIDVQKTKGELKPLFKKNCCFVCAKSIQEVADTRRTESAQE